MHMATVGLCVEAGRRRASYFAVIIVSFGGRDMVTQSRSVKGREGAGPVNKTYGAAVVAEVVCVRTPDGVFFAAWTAQTAEEVVKERLVGLCATA